jgi:hypothetical protein
MAAGQGFKTFVTGEVLTAGDVNGYLMQGINVFTNATARDAAITAPAEGQFAFTKDNNSLWYYDGAAWVASGAAGDIDGVTAGVGISGGGTSGTVTITNSMATAIDAKGDLVPGTGADTFARLAVGANDTVLTADSTTATGLKWAAVAGGSMTLLSTTALSGSSITFSSISQSYRDLRIEIKDPTFSTNNSAIRLRVNSDTGTNYNMFLATSEVGIANSYSGFESLTSFDVTRSYDMQNTSVDASFLYNLYDYKDTTSIRLGDSIASFQKGYSTAGNRILTSGQLYYNNVGTTISSITISMSAGTFSTGTAYLYGVN